MKKFTAFLLLALTLIACSSWFALADDTAAPASTALVMTTPAGPAMMPAHTVTPVEQALATMPAWQALPADKNVGSVLIWVLAFLFPCIGWFISEIMPFLPGKTQGLLHGFILMFQSPHVDPATNTVTLQLDEVKAAIAELTGKVAALPAVAVGATGPQGPAGPAGSGA